MAKNDTFISGLIKDINKELGEDTIMLIEDGSPSDVKHFISTGSTLLDFIMSNRENGGIPVGKISEISGLEGSSKTLVAMQICANAQKAGALAVYMDTENAFNTDFAERVGLDLEHNFVYATPANVEDVFKLIFQLLHNLDEAEKSGKSEFPYVVVVWDSVAATPAEQDVSDENPDPTASVGLKPRILSKAIYTLIKSSGRKNVALVFVNQLRTKIGAPAFSDPYISPGGKAIPYAASVRIRLKQKGKILSAKNKEETVGIQVSAEIHKTRFGPPYRKCDFGVYFKNGVDDTESIIDMIIDRGAIGSKSGGPKGKLLFFKDQNDQTFTRAEFKSKFKNDGEFKKKVLELVKEEMIRDLWSEEDDTVVQPSSSEG